MSKPKIIDGWAIFKDGKIKVDMDGGLDPLLIFNDFDYAKEVELHAGEKLVKVEIRIAKK